MTTKTTTFNIKKVKTNTAGKKFYNEVGRLFLRESERGVSGSIVLNAFDGEYAVFPAEKAEAKEEAAAA